MDLLHAGLHMQLEHAGSVGLMEAALTFCQHSFLFAMLDQNWTKLLHSFRTEYLPLSSEHTAVKTSTDSSLMKC